MDKRINFSRSLNATVMLMLCLLWWGSEAHGQCITPGGLNAYNVYQTSFTVNWTAVSGATGYNYRWKLSSESIWQTGSTSGTTVPYFNRPDDTQHDFQVQSVCGGTTSSWSPTFQVSTLPYPCGTPTGVNINNITSTSAVVNFNGVTGATSYSVFRQPVGGSSFSYGSSTASVSLSSLQPNTQYLVKVRAMCSGGWGAFTADLYFTTLSDSCPGLSGISSSNVTANSADISWNTYSGAQLYRYQYKKDTDVTWTKVNTSANSVTLSGLSSGSQYDYSVKVKCDQGLWSDWSDTFQFNTPVVCSVPASLASSNIATTSATLSWGAVGAALSYDLQYRQGGTSTWTTVNSSSASVSLTGLTQGTAYDWRARTNCSGTSSAYSSIATFTTTAATCDEPGSLSSSGITSSQANVSWAAQTGASDYFLRYKPTSSSSWTSITASSTSTTLSSLTADTEYEWQVRTNCSDTSSPYSASTLFTTLTAGCVVQSGIAVSNIATTSADLAWNTVAGALLYRYQYKEVSETTWTKTNTSATSVTLSSLTPGSVYQYSAKVKCGEGDWSVWSDTFQFTTLAICDIPGNLTASNQSSNAATASWDAVSGAVSYDVRYRLNGTSTWTALNTSATSLNITGLQADEMYDWAVRTNCASSTSSYSSAASFTTLPHCSVPTNLLENSLTNSSASLQWDDMGGNNYTVRFRHSDSTSWNDTTVASTSLNVSDLLATTTYEWQVQTHCTGLSSSFSAIESFLTLNDPCDTAVVYAVSNITTSSATLNWGTISGAQHFDVRIRKKDSIHWTTQNVLTTSWSVAGLDEGSEYEWQVRTNCSTSSSDYTSIAIFTTLPSVCEQPVNLSASALSTSSSTLGWDPVPGVSLYYVNTKSFNASSWMQHSTFGNSFALSGLSAETSYDWFVYAVCGSTHSDTSDTALFTTHSTSCPTPLNLTVSDTGAYGLVLQWDSTYDGGYAVHYRDTLDTLWAVDTVFEDSLIVLGLIPGRAYELKAQSICSGISSPFSASLLVNTSSIPCPRPLNLEASYVGLDSAMLQWDTVPGAHSYEVRYGTGAAGWHSVITSADSLSIDSLEWWSEYEWDVTARCAVDTSIVTERQVFTTLFDSIIGPREITATELGLTSAALEWEPLPGAINYQVSYREVDTAAWNTQITSGTTTTLTGLLAASTYEWQVAAFFATDTSEILTSNFFTTEAPGCDVSGTVSASNPSGSGVDLSWSSVPGNESFTVRYRPVGSDVWQHTLSSSHIVQLDGLAPETQYEFQVQNECTYNTAEFSDAVVFTTDVLESIAEPCRPAHYAYMGVPKKAVQTEAEMDLLARSEFAESYQFIDNLGRLKQSVGVENSPSGLDVIVNYEYDSTGAQTRINLPFTYDYAGQEDLMRCKDNRDFYANEPLVAHTTFPYSETRLGLSPLQQVLETGGTGEDWQIGGVHTALVQPSRLNTSEEVRKFVWNGTAWSADNSFYEPGTIVVSETIFEGRRAISYNAKDGSVPVNVDINGPSTDRDTLYTYNVFDDLGRLIYRVPPMAVLEMETANNWTIDQNMLDKWIPQYSYDSSYHRLQEARSPERGLEVIVYDRLGTPVLRQDENLRNSNMWTFTKYDKHGREILSGLYFDDLHLGRAAMQAYLEASTADLFETQSANAFDLLHGYTNSAFPDVTGDGCEVHFVHYYDDYDFDRDGTPDVTFNAPVALHDLVATNRTRAMAVATKERVLYDLDASLPKDGNGQVVDYQIFSGNKSYDSCPSTPKFQYYKGTNICLIAPDGADGFETSLGSDLADEVCIGADCLGGNGPIWLYNTVFYDDYHRPIGSYSDNHMYGTDSSYLRLDFEGRLRKFWEKLLILDDTLIFQDSVTYYANGKSNRAYSKVNDENGWLLVMDLNYNELQQTIERNLHSLDEGISFLQSIDYRYHLHGHSSRINNRTLSADGSEYGSSDLYGIEYAYESDVTGLMSSHYQGRYDGLVSGLVWRYENEPYSRAYTYNYDLLEQLTRADYTTGEGPASAEDFTVSGLEYDLHGNILGVERQGSRWVNNDWAGFGVIDSLHYVYQGNQLIGVYDGSVDSSGLDFVHRQGDASRKGYESRVSTTGQEDYRYDANGNLVEDRQKGLKVKYNHLNLPVRIVFPERGDSATYIYSASGQKLRKQVWSGSATTQVDYVQGAQYRDSSLQFVTATGAVLIPEDPSNSSFDRVYRLADALGHTRVNFKQGENGKAQVVQKRNYYPFGLGIGSIDSVFEASNANDYLYNGKEKSHDLKGLEWYDYGARNYDLQLARWNSPDAYSESFFPITPYNFVVNDPVNRIDPDGNYAWALYHAMQSGLLDVPEPIFSQSPNLTGMWIDHPERETGPAFYEYVPNGQWIEGVHYVIETDKDGSVWQKRLHPVYYKPHGSEVWKYHNPGWRTMISGPTVRSQEVETPITEKVVSSPEKVIQSPPQVFENLFQDNSSNMKHPTQGFQMEVAAAVNYLVNNPGSMIRVTVTTPRPRYKPTDVFPREEQTFLYSPLGDLSGMTTRAGLLRRTAKIRSIFQDYVDEYQIDLDLDRIDFIQRPGFEGTQRVIIDYPE